MASAIDAPTHYVGQADSVIVDVLSGDIYWTENLGQRVVALRSGASTPVRIAGTGVCNTGSSSSTSDFDGGGAAILTCVAPRNIAVDAIGRPLFITGRFPGTIMRIERDGMLTALAQIPFLDAPGIDGPIANATAWSLGSLTVVNGGSALLVSDTAQAASWSVVRRIDLTAGTITRVAGAFSGPFDDGGALLDTQFTSIGLLAVYPGGNIAIAEVATGRVRIGVVSKNSVSGSCGRVSSIACAQHFCRPACSSTAPRDTRASAGRLCLATARPRTAPRAAFPRCPSLEAVTRLLRKKTARSPAFTLRPRHPVLSALSASTASGRCASRERMAWRRSSRARRVVNRAFREPSQLTPAPSASALAWRVLKAQLRSSLARHFAYPARR